MRLAWTIRLIAALAKAASRFGATIAVLLVTAGVLAAWLHASQSLGDAQPPAKILASIHIKPPASAREAETTFVLGREFLRQNDVVFAAAERHVRIHRLGREWQISNASTSKQLLLEYSDGVEVRASRQFIGRPVREGEDVGPALDARLSSEAGAGAGSMVSAAPLKGGGLRLTIAGAKDAKGATGPARQYDLRQAGAGVSLCPVEGTPGACQTDGGGPLRSLGQRLRSGLIKDSEQLIAKIGGPDTAVNDRVAYIGAPDAPFDALRIVRVPKRGFAFAPGRDRAVRFGPASALWSIYEVRHDVAGTAPASLGPICRETDERRPDSAKPSSVVLTGFYAGRTKYGVCFDGKSKDLVIKPAQNVHRVAPDVADKLFHDQGLAAGESGLIRTELADAPPSGAVWRDDLRRLKALYVYLLAAAALAAAAIYRAVRTVGAAFEPARARTGQAGDLLRSALAGAAVALALAPALGRLPGSGVSEALASPASPYPSILAWTLACAAVFVMRGAGNLSRAVMAAATAVVALGTYTLLALGLSADELNWARSYNDTVGAVERAAAAVALAAAAPPGVWGWFAGWLSRPGRMALPLVGRAPISLALGAVFALWGFFAAFQVFFGSETGVPGFGQPSEIMKTLFVVIGAASATLIMRRNFASRRRPTPAQIMTSIVAIGAVLGVQFGAPILSHDFSPFLILFLTTLASFFLIMIFYLSVQLSMPVGMGIADFSSRPGLRGGWERLRRAGVLQAASRFTRRRVYAAAALVGVPLAFLVLDQAYFATLRDPAKAQAALIDADYLRKPAKRFNSWIELDMIHPGADAASARPIPVVEFPDTGYQVMRSRKAIGVAPCRGPQATPEALRDGASAAAGALPFGVAARDAVDNALGVMCPPGLSPGLPSADEVSLPEIQNDFIAAWAIVALGRDGAFLLALIQCALVGLMLVAAFRTMSRAPGDEDRRAVSTFLASLSVGFATMLFLQFAIAWMNVFGLLPVMGQPMTFVSHAKSHFLFFGAPALIGVLGGLAYRGAQGRAQFGELPDMGARFIPWRGRRAAPANAAAAGV